MTTNQTSPSKASHSIKLEPLTAQPLVSVVIDNYNYGRFLLDAVNSVLSQTYKKIELIIVDDGSTDNSREVIELACKRFADHASADEFPKIIPILQANSGQGGACNTGFARAQGEIICFLDADDYYHPQKIEKVVQAFQAHPDWIQVAHSWLSVDGDGVVRGRSASDLLSQGNVKPLLLQWGKYASGITSALSYRREALAAVMPAPNRCIIDSYLNASVPFYGLVGSLNQPLMYYRMHGKNVQAYNNNIAYLLKERRAIAEFINQTAERQGLSDRFNLMNDVDYRAYSIVEKGQSSVAERLEVIILSIKESIQLRRSLRDSLIRLIFRSICVLSPKEGPILLGMGFKRYVQTKFFRRGSQSPD